MKVYDNRKEFKQDIKSELDKLADKVRKERENPVKRRYVYEESYGYFSVSLEPK